MAAADKNGRTRLPPPPVLVVIASLVLLVPLAAWAEVGLHRWSYRYSPAAVLMAPYFWGVLLLRLVGAFVLAALLFFVRKPASVWMAVTSLWLAGPPFQLLLIGIEMLVLTGGHQSVPPHPSQVLVRSSIGPAVVTLCLLAFRSSRRAYGLSSGTSR
ncbi:MAG: hypothetical protein QOG84_2699 [Sphingomonadales bacterium]|jgi:hypothetical protein|nr:hypothetical protein [Sphingomonadales bacterium]